MQLTQMAAAAPRPPPPWKFARAKLRPHQQLGELELIDVVAARIPARLANTLIRALNSVLPLDDLRHLKRVRKASDQAQQLELILCRPTPTAADGEQLLGPSTSAQPAVQHGEDGAPACTDSPTSLPSGMLAPAAAALVAEHKLETFVVQVPAGAPKTRSQWEQWGAAYWPMAWKVPDGKAPPEGEELFAQDKDQAYFENHMSATLAAAQAGGACNAARIVDPVTGEVMGQGLDCRALHPLDHAAMVAVKVAAARDLVLWPPTAPAACSCDAGTAQGGRTSQPGQEQQHQEQPLSGGNCQPPCAKRQRTSESAGAGGDHSSGNQGLSGGVEVQGGVGGGVVCLPSKPYMCTGYDCFLVHEPCVMCAMGLVHSRLARVIYCRQDTAGGMLGGREHLMAKRSLNHHYMVYHLPLQSELGDF